MKCRKNISLSWWVKSFASILLAKDKIYFQSNLTVKKDFRVSAFGTKVGEMFRAVLDFMLLIVID